MDLTRSQPMQPIESIQPTVSDLAEKPAAPSTWSLRRLSPAWALALAVGWPVGMNIAWALEPAPAHPHAAAPIFIQVLGWIWFLAFVPTIFGAVARHPAAAIGGVVTGASALAMTIACPVSGHHTIGLWFVGQFAVVLGMLAVSIGAVAAHWVPGTSTSTT
jgi:hypothetical protein